jgi:4-diphosphocytidyl-2-C-methyl-D-erythritol kinase
MSSVTIKAFAKVNLGLRILEKRSDGYHNIHTIMQTISLCDTITLTEGERTLVVSTTVGDLPQDETNLCYRAAKSFFEEVGEEKGISIDVQKEIPIGAGLGGGSSDAAAVLVGLNILYSKPLSRKRLGEIALSIGSDVPFFIEGGTAFVSGRGEKIEPLGKGPKFNYLVVFPGFSIDTKWAYDQIKCLTKGENYSSISNYSLNAGSTVDIETLLKNDFEEVMLKEYPELKTIRQLLFQNGATSVSLSGSGSSIFGIFNDREKMDSAHAHLVQLGYWIRKAFSVTSSEIPQFALKE